MNELLDGPQETECVIEQGRDGNGYCYTHQSFDCEAE